MKEEETNVKLGPEAAEAAMQPERWVRILVRGGTGASKRS